ncbi:HNH endonuclease signature motif containing protein [Palleronia sp. LCG004]|uniref:HNH endonuclease signature motif containing protein n=1 Tax=Palleronia sp. LCG004 TaxID=3079304 RepID=UPI0029425E88|nr:HNH endonuclease signature motif containing protein [Palleronia sp. LCG004]WOI54969.1 HNH endonuclease signature motif containing protein [Palleronia sp. LCG004]
MKICSSPGCEDLAEPGASRCASHDASARARRTEQRSKAQTSGQARAGQKLYDRKWRAARLVHLAYHPLCVACAEIGVTTAATDVDHIDPHRGDRSKFWDRSNWQSLCHRCHSRKTALEVFHGKGTGGDPEI